MRVTRRPGRFVFTNFRRSLGIAPNVLAGGLDDAASTLAASAISSMRINREPRPPVAAVRRVTRSLSLLYQPPAGPGARQCQRDVGERVPRWAEIPHGDRAEGCDHGADDTERERVP